MINLIPNQQKKVMRTDFYMRLVVLILFMLALTLIIATVALLPAYFFSVSEKNIAEQKLEVQKQVPLPTFDEQTSSLITDLNQKLDLVEQIQKNKFSISEKVINLVVLNKVPGISIRQISYENTVNKGKKIIVNGTASSRDILLNFRQTLENEKAFSQVDLPISNFVKDSNIQFSLNLIPAP